MHQNWGTEVSGQLQHTQRIVSSVRTISLLGLHDERIILLDFFTGLGRMSACCKNLRLCQCVYLRRDPSGNLQGKSIRGDLSGRCGQWPGTSPGIDRDSVLALEAARRRVLPTMFNISRFWRERNRGVVSWGSSGKPG